MASPMRIFKIKLFHQWAKKLDLLDETLLQSVLEVESGHYEAHLAAHLYKKDTISDKELEALKALAQDYLGLSELLIEKMIKESLLLEIKK